MSKLENVQSWSTLLLSQGFFPNFRLPDDPYRSALRARDSTDWKFLSRLSPYHSRAAYAVPSQARLRTNASGLKISPLKTRASNKENLHSLDKPLIQVRASSADKAAPRIRSASFKLCRDQTKVNISKRSAYLLTLRKSDLKAENTHLHKNKEKVADPPTLVVNDQPLGLSSRRSSITPSPVPIAFGSNTEDSELDQRLPSRNTLKPLSPKVLKPQAPTKSEHTPMYPRTPAGCATERSRFSKGKFQGNTGLHSISSENLECFFLLHNVAQKDLICNRKNRN